MGREIVIDAKGSVLGRLSAFAAKQALQGKNVVIVDSEHAIIIGKKKSILKDYLDRFRLGHGAQKGPIFSRKPEALLRRTIRGMIGRKKAKGKEALSRVKCFSGVPEKYINIEKIKIFKKQPLNFMTLGQLTELAGKL